MTAWVWSFASVQMRAATDEVKENPNYFCILREAHELPVDQTDALFEHTRRRRLEKQNAPLIYTKIHMKYLHHKTLEFYKIKWEYDAVCVVSPCV